jgi:hypothetical protein
MIRKRDHLINALVFFHKSLFFDLWKNRQYKRISQIKKAALLMQPHKIFIQIIIYFDHNKQILHYNL